MVRHSNCLKVDCSLVQLKVLEIAGTSNATKAVILDTGNFVLRNGRRWTFGGALVIRWILGFVERLDSMAYRKENLFRGGI